MAKYCRYCGGEIRPGAFFCRHCGSMLGNAAGYGNDRTAPPRMNVPISPPGGTPAPGGWQNTQGMPPAPANQTEAFLQRRAMQRQAMQQMAGSRRRGPGLKGIVAAVLVVTLFTGLVFPGFLRKGTGVIPVPGLGGLSGKTESAFRGKTKIEPYDTGGHSKPVDVTPMEGVHITARKDALDKDREFRVRPATDEEIEKTADRLGDRVMVVAAMDIDAGLSSEEYLPGTYAVELDMETLGIPAELKDQVAVVRMDDNGDIFPYATDCDGEKIRYTSKQNSVSAVIIYTLGALTVTGAIVWAEEKDFSYYAGKTRTGIGNQHFILEWAVEDFAHFGEESEESVELEAMLNQRSRELYEEALRAIPAEMYRTTSDGQVILTAKADTARRKDVLATWKGQCARDSEYQRLQKKLQESYPPAIKELYRMAELAYDYLTGPEQNAKMPSYQVEILLKRKLENTEAETHKVLYKNVTVNLAFEDILYPKRTVEAAPVDPWAMPGYNPPDIAGGTPDISHVPVEEKDIRDYSREGMETLLLTMVHELFHVSQFMYYSSAIGSAYTSNVRLFEAQANVVEAQAFTHFMNRGLLPTCAANGYTVEKETQEQSHVLTLWNQWEFMAVPLDALPKNKTQSNDSGYNEANYLEYMCKNHGNITMGQMMESFSAGQTFSRTAGLAWGMTEEEQKNSYDKFLQELRDGKLPPQKVNRSEYSVDENITMSSGMYLKRDGMVFSDAENLCYNRMAFAVPQDSEYALVTVALDTGHSGVPDGTGKEGGGLYEIRVSFEVPPAEDLQEVDLEHNIFYMPPRKVSRTEERSIYITELLRVPNGKTPGFEVCAMLPPDKPEVKEDWSKNKLSVKLPRMKQDKFLSMKGIARASEEMGILMTLEREDGEIFEARFKAGDQGKTAELDVKPYLKGWKEKDPPGFEYSIQEYFRIGKTDYTGPKSEAADRPAADVFGEYRTVSTVLEYGSKMFDDLVGSMGLGLGSGVVPEEVKEAIQGYQQYYGAASDAIKGQKSTGTLTITDEGGGRVSARLIYDEKIEGVDTDVTFAGTWNAASGVMTLKVTSVPVAQGTMELRFDERDKVMTCTGICSFDSEIITYKMQLDGEKQ